MKTQGLINRITAARDGQPTFVLKNANVVNVFSEEIIHCDVALYRETIIGLGKYGCENTYDCGGAYLAPGFIDSHVHIESSMSCPPEFARIVLPFGTTSVIADPHEIANVAGMDGIRFMQRCSKKIGLHVSYMFPSAVPCTFFEENGTPLTNEDAVALYYEGTVSGLGEVMDFSSVVACDMDAIKKIGVFTGLPIDGHAPGLSGNALNAYIIAGPETDHEAYEYGEVMEKLRAGMKVLLRVGSAANKMAGLMRRLAEENVPLDNFMFCTDDKHTENILAEGHINHIAKMAVEAGMPAAAAVRMASRNAAEAYGLSRKGAIAPGYDGDMVLFRDLVDFQPVDVFVMGKNIKQIKIEGVDAPPAFLNSVNFATMDEGGFKLRVNGKMPVIEMEEGQLTTRLTYERVPERDGWFTPGAGYAKLASVERHHATGHVGIGIVKNFGLREGAVASTVAHDSHNVAVIGTNDADMRLCLDALKEQGGGYVLVRGGEVLARVELPVCGLLSLRPYEELADEQKAFLRALEKLGVPQESDPMIRLSFFSLPVIPEVRVTSKGVYNVLEGKFI